MWNSVFTSMSHVFAERKLPHRKSRNSLSLSLSSDLSSSDFNIQQNNNNDNNNNNTTSFFKGRDNIKDNMVSLFGPSESLKMIPEENESTVLQEIPKTNMEMELENFTLEKEKEIEREEKENENEEEEEEDEDEEEEEKEDEEGEEEEEIQEEIHEQKQEEIQEEEIQQEEIQEEEEEERYSFGDAIIANEEIMEEYNYINNRGLLASTEMVEEERQRKEIENNKATTEIKTKEEQITKPGGSKKIAKQFSHYHKRSKKKKRKQDTFYIKLSKDHENDEMQNENFESVAIVVEMADYQNIIIPFILSLARALHTCGVPAHRMERMLTIMSNCFGMDSHYFYTPTGLFCSFNSPKPIFSQQKHNYMQFIQLPNLDWDMERLCFLEELCDDIISSRLHISQGVAAIKDIMMLPLRYNPLFEISAVIILSIGYSILFGFTWSQSRACGIASIWTGIMLSVSRKHLTVSHIAPVISGFGAGIIISLYSLYVEPLHTLLACISTLMYHLPCLGVTMAISEFTTGNTVAATARLMGAWASILQVAFGSWAGITIIQLHAKLDVDLPDSPEKWYWMLFATFLASMGYCILCQIPPKLMWVAWISGIVGTIGSQIGFRLNTAGGAFLGAFFICIFANMYARFFKRGLALMPIWMGMLLLVPSSIGVQGFISVANMEIVYGVTYLVIFLKNATGLALGLFTANLIARPKKAL